MFVPEELLVKVEVSSVHCLVENKIVQHCTCLQQHVNSDFICNNSESYYTIRPFQ
jgi:hypothetical protein